MTTAEISIWASAGATVVTAVATGVLAWVTWLLFQATKRMAEATSEPFVVVTLEPNRWSFMHLDLRIENSGTGPAYDVRVVFDPPLMREDDNKKSSIPMSSISVLRPTQSFANFIGVGADFLEDTYTVTTSWVAKPKGKNRTSVAYELNLRHYEGLINLGSGDPAVMIAEELKKVREEFQRMTGGFRRMGIDVYTAEDRAEARSRRRSAPPESDS